MGNGRLREVVVDESFSLKALGTFSVFLIGDRSWEMEAYERWSLAKDSN